MKDIVFLNGDAWPVLAIVGLLSALALSWTYSRFVIPVRMRTRIILLALRFTAVLIVLFLLLDPQWRDRKAMVSETASVLVDTSASMGVTAPGEKSSRLEQVKALIEGDPAWKRIEGAMKLRYYTFDSALQPWEKGKAPLEAKGTQSELVGALRELARLSAGDPAYIGSLVLSDGNATDVPPGGEAARLPTDLPSLVIGVGKAGPVPCVILEDVVFRDKVFKGDRARMAVRWHTESMPPDTKAQLRVLVDGKQALLKAVDPAEEQSAFELEFKELGERRVDIELVSPGEIPGLRSNAARIWVEVLERKVRVFYVESYYKDENVFKKALEEDAVFDVDFAASVLGFSRAKQVPFVKDPLFGLPQEPERIFDYDVIVLSDMKRSLLGDGQIAAIRDLVEKKGGALVMVGGLDSFGDGGYVGTKLEDLLPVEISEEKGRDVFVRAQGTTSNSFRPIVAVSASAHPLLRLVPDPKKNELLWKTVPPLGGYNYVGRLKPGARILLEHPSDKSLYGPRVIMAEQFFGRGRVLAFTSDITPVWGEQFQGWRDEKGAWLYARLWQNALKWLTEGRLRDRLFPVEIEIDPVLAEAGKPTRLVFRRAGLDSWVAGDRLEAELFSQGVRKDAKEFLPAAGIAALEWKLEDLEMGDYELRVSLIAKSAAPAKVSRYFSVGPSRQEARALGFREGLLKRLATVSEGEYLSLEQAPWRLEKSVKRFALAAFRRYHTPFWDQAWMLLLVLGLLCLDWYIRKRSRME